MTELQDVIDTIREILEDPALQKNIKLKLEKVVQELTGADKKNLRLKIDKCINDIEEISNDANIQSFVRTQVWGIVSMLESID
jgi:uncharacterized protein (UPF0147 family)